jgi:hypothetical protein
MRVEAAPIKGIWDANQTVVSQFQMSTFAQEDRLLQAAGK